MGKKHDFKVGDKVLYVGPRHPGIEYGVEYTVSWTNATTARVEIKDGCGLYEIVDAAHLHFLHPAEPAPKPAPPATTFKAGDKVVWIGGHPDEPDDLTVGKKYVIRRVTGVYVVVDDDVNEEHAQPAVYWRLADEPTHANTNTNANTKVITATVLFYPQTGRYTVYGTNEEEATRFIINDMAQDIEGHGPYQMFKLTAEVELPETKIFPAVVAPFEGENYD